MSATIAGAVAARVGAELEVLLDRQVMKVPRPSRHMGDAEPHDVFGGTAVERLAVERISPVVRTMSQIARSGRGLAGAVGAEQRRDAAFVDVEVEAVQHLGLAVDRRAGRLHFEQRRSLVACSRDRRGSRRGLRCTSAGVPSAIFGRSSSATTLSEIDITRFM